MIPFKCHPISWGLKGKQREIQKIRYELGDSWEADVAVATIELDGDVLNRRILEIKMNAGVLALEEYDKELIDLMPDSDEKKVEAFTMLHKHGHITKHELEKEISTINDEPWVHIEVITDYTEELGVSFEIDYNTQFIKFLRSNGYEDGTDDEIIDTYMTDICKTGASEEEIPAFNPASIVGYHKHIHDE